MTPESITLYYREGSSDKVYTVNLGGTGPQWAVAFSYGRRGSTMTTGLKVGAADYLHAKKIYNKLVAEKMNKGYRPADTRGQAISASDSVRLISVPNGVAVDSGLRVMFLEETSEDTIHELITDGAWGMQLKMDGRRQLIRKKGNTVEGINRRGIIIPLADAIADAAHAIPGSGTLDGEAMGDTFHAFDMLADGADISGLSYHERHKRLATVLAGRTGAIKLLPLATTSKDKQALYNMARRTKAEGVVLKHRSGLYVPGRSSFTLKLKFWATASFIVHRINTARSVEVMAWNEYGIGITLGNVTIPPNHRVPQTGDVIEVRYLYCYRGGSLYQPIYLGKRDDIATDECALEQLKFKQENEEDEA